DHPNYIGMYDGRLMDEHVRAFVESADMVMLIGTLQTDFNTGAFTARLDPARTIDIGLNSTRVGPTVYQDVEMADLLLEVVDRRLQKHAPTSIPLGTPTSPDHVTDRAITADQLYPRWIDFIARDDIVIAETGTCSMGLAFGRLPHGARFYNQTLWGAIGWATPAALGAAVAEPDRGLLLITGDGSHQLTAQEICQFHRLGLKPIIFVLNNSGYLIERLLCKDPEIAYNDIAPWNYAELPHALGCKDWFTARVTTLDELDAALHTAARGDRAAYIEVVTGGYESPPLARKLHFTTCPDGSEPYDDTLEGTGLVARHRLGARRIQCLASRRQGHLGAVGPRPHRLRQGVRTRPERRDAAQGMGTDRRPS
ncbi:thiamine pyrophosphate-dependent enzyme, partial [Mycobacterium paraense]|uniref:thiamine pyrophosphate-dependent enzyme n=1 Tax=Mycobacterium paraense TaxID=767916 RepID=UPI0019D38E2A